MDTARIIHSCRCVDCREIIKIPAESRLFVKIRIAHRADGGDGLVSDDPVCIRFISIHQIADLPLNVAYRFIDGAKVVVVGIVGHDGIRHTVGELMGDDIQGLREIIGQACPEQRPAQVVADKRGVVNAVVLFITHVIEDQDWCTLSVTADPADFFIVVIGSAVIVEGKQPDLIPFQVVRTGCHHDPAVIVEEFVAIRDNDLPFNVAEVVHPGAFVTHHRDCQFHFGTIGEVDITGVVHRFHEFKHVSGVKARFTGAVSRPDGCQAVEIFSIHGHIMCQVGEIGGAAETDRGIVGINDPHKPGAFRVFFFNVNMDRYRQDHLGRGFRQQCQFRLVVFNGMLKHDLLCFLSGNAF